MVENAEPRFLQTEGGARLAYHVIPGDTPTVVFLPGFASHMGGTKAMHLERWCRERGRAYLRLDYQGHGKSSGNFEDGSVGVWAEDARTVIEAVTDSPLVLVGSSMGAWIMLLVALRMKPRVQGMLGIASAPDFTEELVHAQLSGAQKAQLNRDGRLERSSPYEDGPNVVTTQMLEDGRQHLLLGEMIPIDCPVRLLHGADDRDVPWEISLRLSERLYSDDVQLVLVKGAGHRLSQPRELTLLSAILERLLEDVAETP